MKDHDELLDIDVEIEFKPVKLGKLEKNRIELSPAELKAIMWLLEVEPDEVSQVLEDMLGG